GLYAFRTGQQGQHALELWLARPDTQAARMLQQPGWTRQIGDMSRYMSRHRPGGRRIALARPCIFGPVIIMQRQPVKAAGWQARCKLLIQLLPRQAIDVAAG